MSGQLNCKNRLGFSVQRWSHCAFKETNQLLHPLHWECSIWMFCLRYYYWLFFSQHDGNCEILNMILIGSISGCWSEDSWIQHVVSLPVPNVAVEQSDPSMTMFAFQRCFELRRHNWVSVSLRCASYSMCWPILEFLCRWWKATVGYALFGNCFEATWGAPLCLASMYRSSCYK